MPASALEKLILPSRVLGYTPAMLDELTTTGEVVWAGAGSTARQGRLGLPLPRRQRTAASAAPAPLELSALHESVLTTLSGGYGLFFRQIADQVRATTHPDCTDQQLADALWDLAWSGRLTNDTLAPLRSLLGSGRTAGSTAHRSRRSVPRGRYGSLTAAARPASRPGRRPCRAAGPAAPGRAGADPPRPRLWHRTLLDRHGVVTRGAVQAEWRAASPRRTASWPPSRTAGRPGAAVWSRVWGRPVRDGRGGGPAAGRLHGSRPPGSDTAPEALVARRGRPGQRVRRARCRGRSPSDGAGHKPGRKAGRWWSWSTAS